MNVQKTNKQDNYLLHVTMKSINKVKKIYFLHNKGKYLAKHITKVSQLPSIHSHGTTHQ